MARIKIDYGIDLGTTNSSIARMEKGEPCIKKTDTLKDTLPSCVTITKKQTIIAGDSALNSLKIDKIRSFRSPNVDTSNTYIEFKRTMGTDKLYHSSNLNKDFTSEELSSEVLKKLKSFINDEDIKAIIITVPAKFTINQKDATIRAAKLAGFRHCELLQEPIAASMAYGLDAKCKSGYWMVFDFGGGTFDAALVKVEEGIMKIIDTEGDNFLGGKNLDFAIVDEILMPDLKNKYTLQSFLEDKAKYEALREALKTYAEDAKIQLSFTNSTNILSNLGDFPEDDKGNEIELDITINDNILETVVIHYFQKAVDICNNLLERNNIQKDKLDSLILVGGPTFSPILRRMLKEQITERVDTSIDPMTAVAKGAALFSSTVDIPNDILENVRDKKKIQLGIAFEPTTIEPEEFVTIKLLKDKCEGTLPGKIYVELLRNDKGWSSGRIEINEHGEVIEVKLQEGKPNAFLIELYEENGNRLESEPNEITIIQGTKVGNATLPYNIGIEIKNRANGKLTLTTIKGLEKNSPMPAKGIRELRTQKVIRPGIKDDIIKIPLYEGENNTEGSLAVYNEHIDDVVITGEEIPKLLPENSEVELTISVNRSGVFSLSAYFPIIDHTHIWEGQRDFVQKEINADWLDSEIQRAKQQLNLIKLDGKIISQDEILEQEDTLNEIEKRFNQGKQDYDRKKEILDNLRRCFRKLDEYQEANEWPKIEEELKKVFYDTENLYKEFEGKLQQLNEDRIKNAFKQWKEQIPEIIKSKNIKIAKSIIDDLRGLGFTILDVGLGANLEIELIKDFQNNFEIHEWKDKGKAKSLINQALQIIRSNPSKQRLRPIVEELYKLLPGIKQKVIPDGSGEVLTD